MVIKIRILLDLYKFLIKWEIVFYLGMVFNFIGVLEIFGFIPDSFRITTTLIIKILEIIIVVLAVMRIIFDFSLEIRKNSWIKEKILKI